MRMALLHMNITSKGSFNPLTDLDIIIKTHAIVMPVQVTSHASYANDEVRN